MPAPVTTDLVWREIDKQMFAVLGYVTPKNEARTVGIVYVVRGRRIYIGSDKSAWKTRHIRKNPHVSLTVTLAKRIPFLPWIKIPAATITLQGEAAVLELTQAARDIQDALMHGVELDAETLDRQAIIEIQPKGEFLTYGVGVGLLTMRNPMEARGRAPV